MEGDAQKDLVLTQARAMVVREYLVENFGFDDSHLKTLGMGKQNGEESGCGLGFDSDSHFPDGNGDTGRQAGTGGQLIHNRCRPASQVTAAAAQKP